MLLVLNRRLRVKPISTRIWNLAIRIPVMLLLLIMLRSADTRGKESTEDMPRVIVFTSLIEPPFLQKSYENKSNSELLEGFIPDLVKKVAQKLKMPYRLKLVSKGGYGTKMEDGTWNGMIGELISGEADIAAAALSIRPWRQEVIDFTDPFLESGIATVLKRPPEGFPLPVSSPRELVNNTMIRYGCIPGSLTQAFFRTTVDIDYRKMSHIMSSTVPSVYEWTSRKGIARVRESDGDYIFFVESVFANYLVGQPPCDLVILDILLNPSKYAFGIKKGSDLTNRINRAIMLLHQSGVIDKLYRKWWRNKCAKRNNRKNNMKDAGLKDNYDLDNKHKRRKGKHSQEFESQYDLDESTPPPRQHHRKLETRTIKLNSGSTLQITLSVLMLCYPFPFINLMNL